ncbi:MAG: glycosyltransferase [Defluviicoccus sp.]|nr:glycosyltransferase [Defluviicoccus sp.]MDG4593758.1 glycosyltransferase [Defluviicoccus sp.]
MNPLVSVVIPAYNAADDLPRCLAALKGQSLPATDYQVIVVDDGSSDATVAAARPFAVDLVEQDNRGAPAARNAGIAIARGTWVAFTDADCVPSRRWLEELLRAVAARADGGSFVGAAGRTVGHNSNTQAARFVDLAGGLDAERHLSHPKWPFAPTCNVLYRRSNLLAVGGFDERYCAYDACDLHARIRPPAGAFPFVPRAVVLHKHRDSWAAYFRQQRGYGRGLAQFMLRHRDDTPWSGGQELKAWGELAGQLAKALIPGKSDAWLLRRGQAAKGLAQRLGFSEVFWNRNARQSWSEPMPDVVSSVHHV